MSFVDFRRPTRNRAARPSGRRAQFSLEPLETRALLSTAQDRLLASLQNNNNSQMVHIDAGDAVRYLDTLATQVRQVAADQTYALNQDINEAKRDRVQADEDGDTATAQADTTAIAADNKEKREVAADVKQDNSFLSDADRQILGIAKLETNQTVADDNGASRGSESTTQSTTNSDTQSTANDQKIVADTAYDYSQAQVIDGEFIEFPPKFDPTTNAPPTAATLATPPTPNYMPATPITPVTPTGQGTTYTGTFTESVPGINTYTSPATADISITGGTLSGTVTISNFPTDTNGSIVGAGYPGTGTFTGTIDSQGDASGTYVLNDNQAGSTGTNGIFTAQVNSAAHTIMVSLNDLAGDSSKISISLQ